MTLVAGLVNGLVAGLASELLGSDLPPLPAGYCFLTDNDGDYLTDNDGSYLIVLCNNVV